MEFVTVQDSMVTTLPELADLPPNFPTRTHVVHNWGVFTVPRHVVRIDIETGIRATHGWQVRYRGTKFFSDGIQADKSRTPKSALALAIAYLARIYVGQSVPMATSERASKGEKVRKAGVRICRRLNRRDFEEVYVEVCHPQYGKAATRLYVGTANTATRDRLNAMLERAYVLRDKLVSEHLALREQESRHGGRFLRT